MRAAAGELVVEDDDGGSRRAVRHIRCFPVMEWIVAACGVVGTICFAMMLAPQAWLNYQEKSASGLSFALVVTWHYAGLFYGAYLLEEGASPWLLLSLGSFLAISSMLQAQFAVYERGWRVYVLAFAAPIAIASGAAVYALARVAPLLSRIVVLVTGNLIPSALFAAGFGPQFLMFCRKQSIAGYSWGVTGFDVAGSAANTAVLLLEGGATNVHAWLDALPFVTIIVLHGVLVAIALSIVAQNWRRAAGAVVLVDGECFYDAADSAEHGARAPLPQFGAAMGESAEAGTTPRHAGTSSSSRSRGAPPHQTHSKCPAASV